MRLPLVAAAIARIAPGRVRLGCRRRPGLWRRHLPLMRLNLSALLCLSRLSLLGLRLDLGALLGLGLNPGALLRLDGLALLRLSGLALRLGGLLMGPRLKLALGPLCLEGLTLPRLLMPLPGLSLLLSFGLGTLTGLGLTLLLTGDAIRLLPGAELLVPCGGLLASPRLLAGGTIGLLPGSRPRALDSRLLARLSLLLPA